MSRRCRVGIGKAGWTGIGWFRKGRVRPGMVRLPRFVVARHGSLWSGLAGLTGRGSVRQGADGQAIDVAWRCMVWLVPVRQAIAQSNN